MTDARNYVTLTITLPGSDAHTTIQRLSRHLRRAAKAYRGAHPAKPTDIPFAQDADDMSLELEKRL